VNALLPQRVVEKPWGVEHLPPPFVAHPATAIGEIWFEPPPALPDLLIKYIFTSEALSVQVHPSDAETLAAGLGRQGKEECWLVIDAEPGAQLGIGFREPLDTGAMRQAALDGSIEQLMQWHSVSAGDFFYIPAGTVHAIGAGISLIEVQQNSEITYRLYDYGRPRELHLEQGLKVAHGTPYDARHCRRIGAKETARLVDGPLFRLDQIAGIPSAGTLEAYASGPLLILPRSGQCSVGGETVLAGGCAVAPDRGAIAFDHDSVCLIAQPIT
jgi:mannose-6-phosphate isomerase